MNALLERTESEEQLHSSPPPPELGVEPIVPRPGSIPGRPAARLAVAWVVIFGLLIGFEPAPQPNVPVPAWATFVATLFLVALPGAFVGFAVRRRWGLRLSVAASALGFALAAGCLQTGHHAGLYPFAEMAGMAALFGLSLAALGARAATSGSSRA